MLKIFNLLILQFFISNYAFAYADPGAGAFILQAIIAFLGVIAFYLGYPIRIIKSFFKKKEKKDEDKIQEKK
tara:strand:- start:2169 stop:2384 length:216 start_codon:yes stop_codon:yes gene_type:complete